MRWKVWPVAALLMIAVQSCSVGGRADVARRAPLPAMQWDGQPGSAAWTRATLAAIDGHGRALVRTVPGDIGRYCPGYAGADRADRAAFWAGLLSALARYESTWNPAASGGGGKWIGLTQIAPATARGYGCAAQSVRALKSGPANLACAVRIAAAQVGRDGAVSGDGSGAWRGLARDWTPFRDPAKRKAMAAWTRQQAYCR